MKSQVNKKMRRLILNNKFLKSVVIIASGTALAQIINLATIPLITRLYGPEAYGMMGSFMSIVNVLIPLSALSYPIAVVLPRKDTVSNIIVRLSLILGIATSLIVLIGLILYTFLKDDSGMPSWYIAVIPLTILILPLQQCGQQWLIRKKQYSVIAKVSIIQSVVLNALKILVGLPFHGVKTLVIITAIGYWLQALQFFHNAKKNGLVIINSKFLRNLPKVSRAYSDFPIYRTPQVLVNALSQSLPIFVMGFYFGATQVGYFSLAQTILGAPVTLLTGALSNVLFPKITQKVNNRELISPLIKKSFLGLVALSTSIYVTIILFGPQLFSFIFGHEWEIGGVYGRWMALYCIFWLSARPAIDAIPSLKIQRQFLIYEVCSLLLRFTGLITGIMIYNDSIYAMIFYSIINALCYFSLLLFVLWESKKYEQKVSWSGN
ncbi:oligosaccharide flippase family protein [Escherichia marmotae]|uniref:lipopolysaccharide biosynthesis protein n=1 Tax=Escherichia marmotae TaxID=1499973 RepID=UPI001E43579D|nr:oligosaccharide flippase family protein [Escherichia marmotae]MED0631617.1 oligosaccharide flippase family protein [Escherichia marmotae]MED8892791.1 oligosaccharide flippase family protein [Escherichia marmotae]